MVLKNTLPNALSNTAKSQPSHFVPLVQPEKEPREVCTFLMCSGVGNELYHIVTQHLLSRYVLIAYGKERMEVCTLNSRLIV